MIPLQPAAGSLHALLRLAGAAEDVDQLVLDHFLDVVAGGLEVLARIEVIRMLDEVGADGAGHGQTQIGVDVDLADRAAGSLTQLLLGDADRVGHAAAVGVDHLDEFLRNGGRAVQNDREAGQALLALVQNVEAQGRRNKDALFISGALRGGELISAVGRADGDGQRVAAGLGDEFLDLLRVGVGGVLGGDVDLVLDACQRTELGLDHDAVIMGVLDDLARDLDVLREGLGGGVDHDGGEAAVDAALAGLKVGTVIQMQGNGDVGILDDSGLDQLHQVSMVRVSARALGDLQNDRRMRLGAGFGDALNDFHVVDVESADSIAAGIGFFKHFGCCNKWHKKNLLCQDMGIIAYRRTKEKS